MNTEKTSLENESQPSCLGAVSGSLFYQIDFGNHLRCKIKVTDNKIEVEGAMNGWGNPVPSNEVIVVELK